MKFSSCANAYFVTSKMERLGGAHEPFHLMMDSDLTKGRKKFSQHACFAGGFWSSIPKGARYMLYRPNIDGRVNKENINRYWKFLEEDWLPIFHNVKISKDRGGIWLDLDKNSEAKNFLILNLVRMFAEYWNSVGEMVQEKDWDGLSSQEKLSRFVTLHAEKGLGGHTAFNAYTINNRFGNKDRYKFRFTKKILETLNNVKARKDKTDINELLMNGVTPHEDAKASTAPSRW